MRRAYYDSVSVRLTNKDKKELENLAKASEIPITKQISTYFREALLKKPLPTKADYEALVADDKNVKDYVTTLRVEAPLKKDIKGLVKDSELTLTEFYRYFIFSSIKKGKLPYTEKDYLIHKLQYDYGVAINE